MPAGERCERPSSAERSTSGVQPGRLAHGPQEKLGSAGAALGLSDRAHDRGGLFAGGGGVNSRPRKQMGRPQGPPLRDPTARQLVHVEP